MRVALVTPSFPPALGGLEAHVDELARGLVERGWDVSVFTRGHKTRDQVVDGIAIHRFATRSRHYAVMPRLWTELRRSAGDFSVVHAHSYHALPALAATLARPQRLVFTPHFHGTGHSPLRTWLHRPYRKIGRLVFDAADVVICVSNAEATLVAEMFPRAMDRLTVIPNGVDVDAIRAAIPHRTDGDVVLASARLEKYKQVGRIVDAMSELGPPFILGITGDGPERRALESRIERLEVSDRVRVLGRVDRSTYLQWLRVASVFVTLSKHEAQGIAVLEALTAGTPVIASDIPAHREIADRANGAVSLVPLNISPAGLATAIRVAAASARHADFSPMSWPQVVDETIAVYHRILRTDISDSHAPAAVPR